MTVLYVVLALVAGVGFGYLIRRYLSSSSLANAEREAERVVRDAKREADTLLKEARLEAKEEVHRVRTEVETELRDRRAEVASLEQRMVQREEQLEARAAERSAKAGGLLFSAAEIAAMNEIAEECGQPRWSLDEFPPES